MDEAVTPVQENDTETLELFNVTEAARNMTNNAKRDAARVAARV